MLTGTQDQVCASSHCNVRLATSQDLNCLVDSNKRGGAGGIDSHGGSVPVEEVGDSVGHDTAGGTGRSVFRNCLAIIVGDGVIVIAHATDVDGSCGVLQAFDGHASRLDTLVDGLKQDTLLRINGLSFVSLDVEELRIEGAGVVVKQIRSQYVGSTMVMTIRVIVAFSLEAVDGSQDIARLLEEFPKFGWG